MPYKYHGSFISYHQALAQQRVGNMITLDSWNKDLESMLARADGFQRKELAKKEREYEAARKKVEAEFQVQKNLVAQETTKAKHTIEQAALNKAAFLLYQDLTNSYQALQEASVPQILTEEEQARVKPFIDQLRANKEHLEVSVALSTVAQSMFATEPHLWKAVEFALSEKKEIPGITSYIGCEKGVCYVLAPVDGEQNKELAQNLESRLLDITGRDHFEIKRVNITNREKQVIGVQTDRISCTPEQEIVNKFLWYTLTLPESEKNRAHILQQAVMEKYNEIEENTPLSSFAQLGITHTLARLDGRVLAFFKEHSIKEINRPEYSLQGLREQGVTEVTYAQAATLTGYTISHCRNLGKTNKVRETGEGKLALESLSSYLLVNQPVERVKSDNPRKARQFDFTSRETSEMRDEASARLNQYGDTLTTAELAHVLGGISTSGALLIGKKLPGTQVRGSTGGLGQNSYQKEAVQEFLTTYDPRPQGCWFKRKE